MGPPCHIPTGPPRRNLVAAFRNWILMESKCVAAQSDSLPVSFNFMAWCTFFVVQTNSIVSLCLIICQIVQATLPGCPKRPPTPNSRQAPKGGLFEIHFTPVCFCLLPLTPPRFDFPSLLQAIKTGFYANKIGRRRRRCLPCNDP